MAAQHDLTYALRNGELVSISQVGRGLQPDCVCPACGSVLIAKKGPLVRHHFAHVSGNACETAAETALHLLAKKVICSKGTVLALPAYEIVGRLNLGTNANTLSEVVPGVGGKAIRIAHGRPEVQFDGLTADAVIEAASGGGRSGKRLIVEISVTHPCGKPKIQRLAAVGIPAVEIDMTRFRFAQGFCEQSVQQALLDEGSVKWLYHPKEVKARQLLAARIRQNRISDPWRELALNQPGSTPFKPKGSVAGSRWMGWDRFFAKYEACYGPVSLEDLRALQERYFGTRRRRIDPPGR